MINLLTKTAIQNCGYLLVCWQTRWILDRRASEYFAWIVLAVFGQVSPTKALLKFHRLQKRLQCCSGKTRKRAYLIETNGRGEWI